MDLSVVLKSEQDLPSMNAQSTKLFCSIEFLILNLTNAIIMLHYFVINYT